MKKTLLFIVFSMLISSQVFAQVNSENVNSSKNISTKTEIGIFKSADRIGIT